MRVALDTNIFAYVEGVESSEHDQSKIAIARLLVRRLAETGATVVISAQVMVELHYLLRRKRRLGADQVGDVVQRLAGRWGVVATDGDVLDEAWTIASRHRFQTFDAVILAAAAASGCELLLSEDMQDGFVWRGVTVLNPFAAGPDPRISGLLAEARRPNLN